MAHLQVLCQLPQDPIPQQQTTEKVNRFSAARRFPDGQSPTTIIPNEAYQYTPIPRESKGFRVLQLHPGERHELPRCDIQHVSLTNHPPYEALSYVWSPDRASRRILCGSSQTILRVSMSCFLALKDLRHLTEPRSLWIDAICINQKSDEEKTRQVRLMGNIYQSASRVLIRPTIAHPKNFDFASVLVAINRRRHGQNELPVPPRLSREYSELSSDDGVTGIQKFIENSEWFKRTWALQEAALAQNAVLIAPEIEIPWSEFLDTLGEVRKSRYFGSAYARNIADLRLALRRPKQMDLARLLRATRITEASDIRDKLLALVAIASDGDHFINAIDYAKPPELVFVDFTRECLSRMGNLDILSTTCGQGQPRSDLPTWVSGWLRHNPRHHEIVDQQNALKRYSACVDLQPTSETREQDPLVLTVRGLIVDVIRSKSEASKSVGIDRKVWCKDAYRWFLERDHHYGTQTETTFLNTLGCGRTARQVGSAMEICPEMVHHYIKPDVKIPRGQPDDLWQDLTRTVLSEYLHDRCLVETKRGYLGLATSSVKEGDLVCILASASIPFILREATDQNGKYELIGECYIHDIMHGEAMEGRQGGLQDFKLV